MNYYYIILVALYIKCSEINLYITISQKYMHSNLHKTDDERLIDILLILVIT